MFIKVGLHLLRQHLTQFAKCVDDQTFDKNTPGHLTKYSNRHHNYYNLGLEEIITNPVPFDANIVGHRVTAIVHEPLLGLIIVTANIAASTITKKASTTKNGVKFMKKVKRYFIFGSYDSALAAL